MLQILLNHFFRHLAYRGTKISSCPEMSAPIFLLQVRKLFEQLARRTTLDSPHDLTRCHCRWTARQNMHVILAHRTLHYPDLKGFAGLSHQITNSLRHLSAEHLVSVLRYPYEVILNLKHRMTAVPQNRLETEINEILLEPRGSHARLAACLEQNGFRVFHDDDKGHWVPRIDAAKAALAAELLRNEGKRQSYLTYFFVGLAISAANREKQFCAACGWRLRSPSKQFHCQACSTSRGESNGKVENLRQRRTAEALKDSPEYQSFMEVRERGREQLLRLAAGQAEPPASPLVCDPEDCTPDHEYRRLKEALAGTWARHIPNLRKQKAADTEKELVELARQGLSRAEAARRLGLSRAGVTMACRRNPKLQQLFVNYKLPD